MNERKIISLLQSEEFLAKLNDAETVAETKKLFKSEGIDISEDKIKTIMEALKSANQKAHDGEILNEKDLEAVSGGVIGAITAVILGTLVAVEGGRVGYKAYKQGALRTGAEKLLEKSKNAALKIGGTIANAEDTVVQWLSTPVQK